MHDAWREGYLEHPFRNYLYGHADAADDGFVFPTDVIEFTKVVPMLVAKAASHGISVDISLTNLSVKQKR